MLTLRRQAAAALALGVAALVPVALTHLALTDIAHGEPNPVAEWRMVQIGFGIVVVALVTGVATLLRVMRSGS